MAGEVTASEVTQAQYEEALRLFHRAIELDPSYATAFAWAAQCYAVRKGNGWMADPEREMAEAYRLEHAELLTSATMMQWRSALQDGQSDTLGAT